MFQIGDTVIYGCKGLHVIHDCTPLSIKGMEQDRPYYLMQPYGKPEGIIYLPCDLGETQLRFALEEKEARKILKKLPSLSPISLGSPKAQEEAYKTNLHRALPEGILRVIKTLLLRKKDRLEKKKKPTATDSRFLLQAESILYPELSYALRLDREEIRERIIEAVTCDTALRL